MIIRKPFSRDRPLLPSISTDLKEYSDGPYTKLSGKPAGARRLLKLMLVFAIVVFLSIPLGLPSWLHTALYYANGAQYHSHNPFRDRWISSRTQIGVPPKVKLNWPILLPVLDQSDRRYDETTLVKPEGLLLSVAEVVASPKVVLVLPLDRDNFDVEHLKTVLNNRVEYAQLHGLGLFAKFVQDFQHPDSGLHVASSPIPKTPLQNSWLGPLTVRAAMQTFPKAEYFWFLDQHSAIVDMAHDISTLLEADTLERAMLRSNPLVRNSDHVKTFQFNQPADVSLILTQDEEGLSGSSFIVKNDLTARIFLDYWSDQCHSAYGPFFRGPGAALSHMMQWHSVFLPNLALVQPQHLAKMTSVPAHLSSDLLFGPSDFVVSHTRSCFDRPESCASEYSAFAGQ